MVASSTEHRAIQWGAVYGLLEVHSHQNDLEAVSQYVPRLLKLALTPYQQAHAYALLGDCYQRLGKAKMAREFRQRAIAMASEHGIPNWLLKPQSHSDVASRRSRHGSRRNPRVAQA